MQQIEIDEVESNISRLIERALQGEEVIITQANRPVLKLVHTAQFSSRRKRGSAKGQIQIAPDFDAPLEDFQPYTS